MKLINLNNHHILAEQVIVADTFLKRLKGLLLTETFPSDCGLHIRPCRGIHTFFMQYPIDVLHLDSRQQVVGVEENLEPGRIGSIFPRTAEVVELPAGKIQQTKTRIGHRLQFIEEKI